MESKSEIIEQGFIFFYISLFCYFLALCFLQPWKTLLLLWEANTMDIMSKKQKEWGMTWLNRQKQWEKRYDNVAQRRVLACRPRRGVLPIMAKTRRLCPKGVPLSGFRVGSLLGGVYERVGKSVILVCKKAQRANRCILLVWKSWEKVLVLWFIHI